jgi:hypothetical protein
MAVTNTDKIIKYFENQRRGFLGHFKQSKQQKPRCMKKKFLRKRTLYLVVKNQLLEGGQVAVLSIG